MDDHIAHHIAVIVLAGPDKAALRADDPGHRVVNQGVKIGDARLLKFGLIFLLVQAPAKMSLKVWSYRLEMVSLVENHRSCRVSRAY